MAASKSLNDAEIAEILSRARFARRLKVGSADARQGAGLNPA